MEAGMSIADAVMGIEKEQRGSGNTTRTEGLVARLFSAMRSTAFTAASTLLAYSTIGFTGIGYGTMIALAKVVRNWKSRINTRYSEIMSYYNIGNLLGFLDFGALTWINTLPGDTFAQKMWKGFLFNPLYTFIYNPLYLGIRHLKEKYGTILNTIRHFLGDSKNVVNGMLSDVRKNIWQFNKDSFIYSGIPNWIAVNLTDDIPLQNTLGGIADVGYAAIASRY